jgi:hypothetical protein
MEKITRRLDCKLACKLIVYSVDGVDCGMALIAEAWVKNDKLKTRGIKWFFFVVFYNLNDPTWIYDIYFP